VSLPVTLDTGLSFSTLPINFLFLPFNYFLSATQFIHLLATTNLLDFNIIFVFSEDYAQRRFPELRYMDMAPYIHEGRQGSQLTL